MPAKDKPLSFEDGNVPEKMTPGWH
jgi:hypothetical protein